MPKFTIKKKGETCNLRPFIDYYSLSWYLLFDTDS